MESGQEDVTEEEGRELFLMMIDEYNEMMSTDLKELGLTKPGGHDGVGAEQLQNSGTVKPETTPPSSHAGREKLAPSAMQSVRVDVLHEDSGREDLNGKIFEPSKEALKGKNFNAIVEELKDEWKDQGFDIGDDETTVNGLGGSGTSDDTKKPAGSQAVPRHQTGATTEASRQRQIEAYDESFSVSTFESLVDEEEEARVFSTSRMSVVDLASAEMVDMEVREEGDAHLEELRQLFPAFSDKRLRSILYVFQTSLGDPPMLELIPIVRENMPDYITATWLKQMSLLTAKFVFQKAAQDDLINVEMLNGMLELHASSGSLDRAIDFHQTEFESYQLEPTAYSDRLVLQMLLKNNRLSRALAFKQKVEASGRSLDIKAYGSLVEYCSRRQQLGSAMLLLRECLSVHGAPPEESTLSNFRLLCRQAGLVEDVALDSMIGQDPVEWLRHGEAELKREMSKRGRRDVQMARNSLVRL